MERKNLLYWGIQLIGWTVYFLFSILLLYSSNELILTFNLFLFGSLSVLASILLSHGIRYIILRYDVISWKIIYIVLMTLFLSVIGGFLLDTIQFYIIEGSWITIDYIVNPPIDDAFTWPSFLWAVSRSIILFMLWCGFYYAFIISEKSREQEILNLKWEASKNEIELKNLRAQLNPHFLFNSLNSIRALIELNPDEAKKSVTQLSNLLRRSISLGKLRLIPLKEELDLVKIYLSLEKVRFEERLETEYLIDEEILNSQIPPLMLQTIVENGIKHGISKSIDGGKILLKTEFSDTELILTVINTGHLDKQTDSAGVGISNTKKRLEIIFGKQASFNIEQAGPNVLTKIRIGYETKRKK